MDKKTTDCLTKSTISKANRSAQKEQLAHDENVAQGEFRIPIPFEGIDTNVTCFLFDIWMPYASTKCGSRRTFRVIIGNREAQLPEPLRIWRSLWASQKHRELA